MVSTVKFLIENYNMKPQEKGKYGMNVFMWASYRGQIELLEYLLSFDHDLANDKDKYGDTALTLAARYADVSTVKFLIENYNMRPEEKGWLGRNAFLKAARAGNETV